jgi:hypothetical protein
MIEIAYKKFAELNLYFFRTGDFYFTFLDMGSCDFQWNNEAIHIQELDEICRI